MTVGLIFIAALVAAAPGSVTASSTLEPAVIPYHRQATFTIEVDAPPEANVDIPDMTGRLGGLDVYGEADYTSETSRDGQRHYTVRYTIDAIRAGDYPIQPVTIRWGEDQELTIPSPVLRVRDLTPEEEAAAETFTPNDGPAGPDETVSQWMYWVGLAAILAVCAAIWAYMVVRRRQQKAAPPTPPWELAFDRLRVLDERHLPKAGKFDTYYVELSHILRQYIEDHLGLHAPERTTQEFLGEASKSGQLSQDHESFLARFLRHSDRVKFARYQPTVSEMERSFADVLQFIDETIPRSEKEEVAA